MTELTAKLHELHKRRGELIRELDRSRALKSLWMEVFNHGGAKSHWAGLTHNPSGVGGKQPEHKLHEFIVTNGLGESRTFSFNEVPKLLGGGRDN